MSKEWKKGDKVKINQPELAGKIFTIEEISTEGVVFVTRGFQRLAVQERYLRGVFDEELEELSLVGNLQAGDWVWINLEDGPSLIPYQIKGFTYGIAACLVGEGGNPGPMTPIAALVKILGQEGRLIPGQYVGPRDHIDPPSEKKGVVTTSEEKTATVLWPDGSREVIPNDHLYICAPYFQVGSPAEIAYYKGDWDKIHANRCNTEPLTPEVDPRPPGFAWAHVGNKCVEMSYEKAQLEGLEIGMSSPEDGDKWLREFRRYEISRDIFLKSINREWSKDLNVKVLAVQAVTLAETLLDALEGKI